jgi:hypothetical protein
MGLYRMGLKWGPKGNSRNQICCDLGVKLSLGLNKTDLAAKSDSSITQQT